MIHRIIREHLGQKLDIRRQDKLNKKMANIAKISSERERIAEEAGA